MTAPATATRAPGSPRLAADILVVLILVLCCWLQYQYAIAPVRSFDWLGFLDHDTIYQVERFLVNMGWPGVEEINSSPSDYGSEFSLLILPFRALAQLSHAPGPLLAYQFLTLFHIGCAALALWVFARMIGRRTESLFAGPAFVLLVVSSPIFVQYMAFLKPDPNVVLLCLALGLACLDRFERSENISLFLVASAWAGLGAAVKWWGLFLVPPLAWAAYVRRKDPTAPFRLHALGAFLTTGTAAVAAAIFLANPAMVRLCDLLAQVLAAKQSLTAQAIRSRLVLDGALTRDQKVLAWGVALALIALAIGGSFALWRARVRIVSRARTSPLAGWLWSAWVAGIGFLFFLLVFDSPFLLTSQVFFSAGRYSSFALGASPIPQSFLAQLAHNVFGWITAAHQERLTTPFLLAGLGLALLLAARSGARDRLLAYTLLLLAPLTVFLFLLVTKKNGATMAMLLPVAYLFVFLAVEKLRPGMNASRLIAAVCLAALLQSAWNLAGDQPNLALWPHSRDGLQQEIARLNASLRDRLGGPYSRLVLANRDFPMDSGAGNARLMQWEEGIRGADDKLLGKLTPGAILVTPATATSLNLLAQAAGLEALPPLVGKRFTRAGHVLEGPLFVCWGVPYKKKD
ncbi:hypothetical protein JCM15519_17870 [Fundidesulfovibrio butyratiphilus]